MGERICPYCGARLDPDEHCDCQDNEEKKESPEPASKQD